MRSKHIGDLLPIWHFDDDLMVFSDGSLGAGFKIQGRDISCAEPEVINTFVIGLENLLNTAFEGLKLQIFYRFTSDVKDIIENHEKISPGFLREYKKLSESRISFFKRNIENNYYFQPEIYLFIRSSAYKYKKQKLFNSEKRFSRMSKKEYEKHREVFLRNVKQVETSLDSCILIYRDQKKFQFLL